MSESAKWCDLVDRAIAFRHKLHRAPELAWGEVETARAIRAELDRLSIPWVSCAQTGTIARLASSASGRSVALRGDIDGLPILEETGLPHASTMDGRMHACGHDGHTATLLAVATWLKSFEKELPGPVSLFFQPAEEGGHGASRMIDEGALEGIDAIYGWHNWPAIPVGRAACPEGAVMAANATFRLDLRGRGGHSSQPDQCRDPVLAAAAVTTALQQIVARRLAPHATTVVSVTWIDARSGDTIIPETAALGGSIRCANSESRDDLRDLITSIAVDTAHAHGVEAEMTWTMRYTATINDRGEAGAMQAVLAEVLGPDWPSDLAMPAMASEDFGAFLERCPGAYALIGAGDGAAHTAPCHSPRYDFNDELIAPAAAVMIRLAGGPAPPLAASGGLAPPFQAPGGPAPPVPTPGGPVPPVPTSGGPVPPFPKGEA